MVYTGSLCSLGWSSPSNSGSHFLGGSELKAWRVSSLEGPGLSYISNRGLFETEQHLDSNMPDMQHHLTQQNHWPNVGGKRGFSQAKQQRCGASSTICTNAMAWDLVEMLRKSKRKMTEVFGHVTKRWGYHGKNIYQFKKTIKNIAFVTSLTSLSVLRRFRVCNVNNDISVLSVNLHTRELAFRYPRCTCSPGCMTI